VVWNWQARRAPTSASTKAPHDIEYGLSSSELDRFCVETAGIGLAVGQFFRCGERSAPATPSWVASQSPVEIDGTNRWEKTRANHIADGGPGRRSGTSSAAPGQPARDQARAPAGRNPRAGPCQPPATSPPLGAKAGAEEGVVDRLAGADTETVNGTANSRRFMYIVPWKSSDTAIFGKAYEQPVAEGFGAVTVMNSSVRWCIFDARKTRIGNKTALRGSRERSRGEK